jgi:two-component system, response regulator
MTSRSILLVEDNPDDEALTLRALRKNDIPNQVNVAHDGAEALEFLFEDRAEDGAEGGSQAGSPAGSRCRPLPGLILLDLKLPKIDGLEVLRRIRAHPRTQIVPVVILTSSKLDDDVLASYQNGANSYVRKPVKFADFTEAVKALGAFWLLLNEPAPEISPASG